MYLDEFQKKSENLDHFSTNIFRPKMVMILSDIIKSPTEKVILQVHFETTELGMDLCKCGQFIF